MLPSGHRHLLIVVCASLALAGGCCTIMDGKTQTVSISSTPPGANAVVGGQTFITPGEVTLARNKSYTVTFTKEGYQSATLGIKKTVNPWIFGNILIGGIPGIVVDLITGSATQLTPASLHAYLRVAR